jgi:hypothetical protein
VGTKSIVNLDTGEGLGFMCKETGAGAYTRPLFSSTSAVLVTPPRVPLSNRLRETMRPTYPTKCADVEPKSGPVSAPGRGWCCATPWRTWTTSTEGAYTRSHFRST